jgi:hypothetical protein
MTDAKSLFEELKSFLEEAPACKEAARPLKDGVEIGVQFHGVPGEYRVVKENGRLTVKEGRAKSPDWTAVLTPAAVINVKALPNADIGELGVEILRRMARGLNDPNSEDHIKVQLTAGFFTIMRHGYLGILPLGGPKVAKWLAQHGLKNVSGIKRVFKKLRGSED